MCWLPLKIRPLLSASAVVVLCKRHPLKSRQWTNRAKPAFLCPDRQMEISLTKAYSFPLIFFFCFCIGVDDKQMQNPACSSSTCEPGAPAPNTSASLKPLKIHGCFSQMCWGKQADRSHLFSATVEHLALSTMIFW